MTDGRISREQMWMDIAHVAARRSTCYRGNVGAVLIKDRTILSVAYNGPPAGHPHCTGSTCERTTEGGCARSLHAEENALLRARGEPEGSELFVTLSPCIHCATLISRHGVKRVFYASEYRDRNPIQYLWDQGIEAYRLSPNGMLIHPITNELLT